MSRISLFIYFFILQIFVLSSCRKIERIMMVSTGSAESVTVNSAIIAGRIIDAGENASGYGHCYSKIPGAGSAGFVTEMKQPRNDLIFKSSIIGLEPSTKYFVRAYIRNGDHVTYGKEISFTTLPVDPVYIHSVIETTAPAIIEIVYSIPLANILPPVSAFIVKNGSRTVNINQVTVAGSKVFLTMAEPAASGDSLTFSYTKPTSNPVQTPSGGIAETLTNRNITNNVAPPPQSPVLVSAIVENAIPENVQLIYDLPLASIIPGPSAFKVTVNSETSNIVMVKVEGNKVILVLLKAVAPNDVLTVSYIRPSLNPLQTPSGGLAETVTAQNVTNKVLPPPANPPEKPVLTGSLIESDTPALLKMNFNLQLANIVPDASAFIVTVNSANRSLSHVSVSDYRVFINLSAAVSFGDVITVSYIKPSSNQLQTTQGGMAETILDQSVTNNVGPECSGGQISNTTPSVIELTFTSLLAEVIPDMSAFTILVNSVPRGITSVIVSGSTVLLTISSAIAYGDIVTAAYTRPAANPLQSVSGKLVQSFSARQVNNKILIPIPVYLSSAVEDYSPSLIEMTYDMELANIVPAVSSFNVNINSVNRIISTVAVSGNKVRLVLSKPVRAGEVVKISYSRPAVNALQTTLGGQAESISSQSVQNKVR